MIRERFGNTDVHGYSSLCLQIHFFFHSLASTSGRTRQNADFLESHLFGLKEACICVAGSFHRFAINKGLRYKRYGHYFEVFSVVSVISV